MKNGLLLFALMFLGSLGGAAQPMTPRQVMDGFHEFHVASQRRDSIALRTLSPKLETYRELYKSFLGQKNTGIVTLAFERECKMKLETGVIDSIELERRANQCPTVYFFGKAQNFSFRRSKYVERHQADISFDGNNLIYSSGVLSQALMVQLGDVDLEALTLDSKGVTFLRDYIPSKTPEAVDLQRSVIEKGIAEKGYHYLRGGNAAVRMTFGLRVIAYRADMAERKYAGGRVITIDPLYGDTRADIIVAFRIVASDEYGVTLIWKEMQRKTSPKFDK